MNDISLEPTNTNVTNTNTSNTPNTTNTNTSGSNIPTPTTNAQPNTPTKEEKKSVEDAPKSPNKEEVCFLFYFHFNFYLNLCFPLFLCLETNQFGIFIVI